METLVIVYSMSHTMVEWCQWDATHESPFKLKHGSFCPVLCRDLVLYFIHVADLSPGQLWAAEDVLGEGTLIAPFPWNDWEGKEDMRN